MKKAATKKYEPMEEDSSSSRKRCFSRGRTYTLVHLRPDVPINDRTGTHFGPEDAHARVRLRESLEKLTERQHDITMHKLILTRYLDSVRENALQQKLENLILQLKPAELLLNEEAQRLILTLKTPEKPPSRKGSSFLNLFSRSDSKKQDDNFLTERHKVFNPIHSLIENMRACLTIKIPDVNNALQRLIDYYQNYYRQVCDASQEKRKILLSGPAMLCTSEGDYYLLSEEIAQKILPLTKDGYRAKTNTAGSHPVSNYGGIHFKVEPDAPGIEFAIDHLNRLIANAGSTPSALFKIYRQDHQYALLASKSVEGLMVFDLLEKHLDFLEHMDPNNFSTMVVSSILSSPQDGKADNYMGRFKVNREGEIEPVIITNVDQDMGFSPAFVLDPSREESPEDSSSARRSTRPEHLLGIRNILYFFPQMTKPIGEDFRKHLQTLPVVLLLLDWLKTLMLYNQECKALSQKGVLTPEEMDTLQLPVRFKPGTIAEIYRKLQALVRLCQSKRSLTNADLLKTVDNHLWQVYQLCYQQAEGDILEAYFKLAHASVEDLLQTATPEVAMDILECVSHYTEGPLDFTDRTQTLGETLQELLSVVDFSELSIAHQKQIIERLLTFQVFTNIRLSHCEALNDELLFQFAQNAPHLTRLTLHECPNITEAGLASLALHRPNLALSVSQNEQIAHYEWPTVAHSFRGGFDLLFPDGFTLCFPLEKKTIDAKGLLITAAHIGSDEGVKFLLHNGADVNQRDTKSKFTALHRAAEIGDEAIVKYLLTIKGIEVDATDPVKHETPLQLAVRGGHQSCVEALLLHGADPKHNNHREQTAIHLAARWGTPALLYTLLQEGEDYTLLCQAKDDQDKVLLHYAAGNPESGVLSYCLDLMSDRDRNTPDHIGSRPLHVAAMEGLLDNVELLLKKGADLNCANNLGVTPCELAERLGHMDIVEYLRLHTALMTMPASPPPKAGEQAKTKEECELLKAIDTEEFDTAEALIERGQTIKNPLIFLTDRHGNTALHKVSEGTDRHPENYEGLRGGGRERARLDMGYLHMLNLLLDAGIHVNTRNKFCETPLQLAVRVSRSLSLVECLLKKGADLFCENDRGTTIMHEVTAVQKNQFQLVRFLLENGASSLLKREDENGMTPLLQIVGKEYYPEQHKVFHYVLKYLMANDKAYAIGLPTTLDHQKTVALETALHLAGSRGDVVMLEALLRLMREINAKDFNGNTALHRTIHHYQDLLKEYVRTERAGAVPSDDFISYMMQTEQCIKALLKAGALVHIKNCKGERPTTMLKPIPYLYELLMNTKQAAEENNTESYPATVKRFLSLDEQFVKVYSQVTAHPLPGFSKADYQHFFDRYKDIYAQVRGTEVSLKISENVLLKDVHCAQGEMKKGYVTSGHPDDLLTYHAEFFNQVFQRIYDHRMIQGELDTFRKCYQQLKRQEKLSDADDDLTAKKDADSDGTPSSHVLPLLRELQEKLQEPACKDLYTKYSRELRTLEEYLEHDIPRLEHTDVLSFEIENRQSYYHSMETWLSEEMSQQSREGKKEASPEEPQGEKEAPSEEPQGKKEKHDGRGSLSRPGFFSSASEARNLLDHVEIIPNDTGTVMLIFQELQRAQAFQRMLQETGFHKPSSSSSIDHKKIEPISLGDESQEDRFKITITADEFNAVTHENAYEELVEARAVELS